MSNKVLLVDDDRHVINALTRALRHEPYEILSANSANEALDIMAGAHVDAVVSDEKMPGMSGSEFLAVVCEKYPDTIRILLTGHASLEVAIRAINEGEIYRFFTKPWNDVDLAISIRKALQQKELIVKSRLLLKKVKEQSSILQELEKEHPGITKVKKDSSGAIVVDDIAEIERYIESFLDVKYE